MTTLQFLCCATKMRQVILSNDADVRLAAAAIARWAVDADGSGQRKPPDPIHEWVTEGRRTQWERAHAAGAEWAQHTPYSSCGDLAHSVMYLLGCRDEHLVNRDSDGGVTPWRAGVNISRLQGNAAYVHARSGLVPGLGDILHVQAPDHVCVMCSPMGPTVSTSDYGGPYGVWHPDATVTCSGGLYTVRGRRLVGWLDVCEVARSEDAIVPDDCAALELDQPYAPLWRRTT